MKKGYIKKSAVALLMSGIMITPIAFSGCASGEPGENGKSAYEIAVEHGFNGTEEEWLQSLKSPSVDISDDGYWVIGGNKTNIKAKGEDGEPGVAGTNSYTYVRYAFDAHGTGISSDPNGRKYICILTTDKVNPDNSDFTRWIKYVGNTGEQGETGPAGPQGATGESGTSNFIYIAYAEDSEGNGFATEYADGLKYIAILHTNTEIAELKASNFEDCIWIKFVGDDGAAGEQGPVGPEGPQGPEGSTGESGTSNFIYIAYATDNIGTGFTTAYEEGQNLKYMAILQSNTEISELNASHFGGCTWIKFVGDDGTDNIYIAFAMDREGTGYATTYIEDSGLDYIGILTTTERIDNLTAEHFEGKWIKFKGETSYVGYDGYLWYSAERSEYKVMDPLGDNVADNTIGLAGNQFFNSKAITAGTPVALMNHYFPTIQKTGYSGAIISKVQVYAENEGTLTISTAKVENIVNRTTSNSVTLNSIAQYTLRQGINTITFDSPIKVGDDETLVLGKSGDTAQLLYYQGLGYEEIHGSFANLREIPTDCPYSETNDINNKLVIKVEIAGEEQNVSEEAIAGFGEYMKNLADNQPNYYQKVSTGKAPYTFESRTLFENKRIAYIDVYAKSISAIDANQYITVRVMDVIGSDLVQNRDVRFYAKLEDLQKMEIADTANVNSILRLYADEDIILEDDQTLAFGHDQNIAWAYSSDPNSKFKKFYCVGTDNYDTQNTLCVNVYTHSINWSEHIKNLQEEENTAHRDSVLKEVLFGKNFSILGDSISTYEGAHDNAIGKDDHVWYNDSNLYSVDNTWWKQSADTTGMNVLVNNSWSGSTVMGDGYQSAINRCVDLGEGVIIDDLPADIDPNIIAVYMGTNDVRNGYACNTLSRMDEADYYTAIEAELFIPTTADEAYARMIYLITKYYEFADIYCFTIPKMQDIIDKGHEELRLHYNEAIKKIAARYGCTVVDLANTELSENYKLYTIDNNGEFVHPNAHGMDIMTDAFLDAMYSNYSNKE